MVAAQPIAARLRGRTPLAAAGGTARRPRTKSHATLAVENSGGRPRLYEWWRRGEMPLEVRDGRDAARLERTGETRARRGASRSWEDVVARRALIVARHRPETIGRTSRTHGTCGTTTSSRVDETIIVSSGIRRAFWFRWSEVKPAEPPRAKLIVISTKPLSTCNRA